jgi:hypothetical protein
MGIMTHLTADPQAATVIAVRHPPSVSRGTALDCRPISPRRQLPLTAGFFTPGGFIGWKSWEWMEWLDGLNVWWKSMGTLLQPLESLELPG